MEKIFKYGILIIKVVSDKMSVRKTLKEEKEIIMGGLRLGDMDSFLSSQ